MISLDLLSAAIWVSPSRTKVRQTRLGT